MIKDTGIILFIGLVFSLISCATSTVSDENKQRKETVVYYSPAHISGARTIVPMTAKRIRVKNKKRIVSQQLYKDIRSILNSPCSGGKPQDNMMILAQIDAGYIAIHQNGNISVNNVVCNDITTNKSHDIIKLLGLEVKIKGKIIK